MAEPFDLRTLQPDTVLIARAPGETRYALLADEIVLAVVHRRDVETQPGAVYFGRVRAPVPGTGAVFVDYGDKLPGVLAAKPALTEGAAVAVTVAVPPRPEKGASLKMVDLSIPEGAKIPALAAPAPEPVVDWCARYGATLRAVICQPLREAARVRALLGDEVPVESHSGPDLFAAFGVDEVIESALRPEVKLPSGGSIVIETTRAATTIDVNSGSADPAKANLEALHAAALELRRREISGHILIDVIPVKARAPLARVLTKVLAADTSPCQVAGFTPLGMLELTRQRMGLSLAEVLGDGGKLSIATVAYRVLRAAMRDGVTAGAGGVTITVAPDVAALLQGALARAVVEAREITKTEIRIEARAGFTREQVDIRTA